jgi:hypothetical protein|tara:strand:+ start:19 stop:501 length:483 start_codon:yes stop_codon:yes gene_type:complete
MKKIFALLTLSTLLVGCVETVALLGPASSAFGGGNLVQSSLSSAVNYGVKKQTGKSPIQHALAFADEKNPNKKKERCISSIKKTNSEVCMIVNKQIALAQTTVVKKISSKQNHIKEKTQVVLKKTIEAKNSPRKFILDLQTKIKRYDDRWLDRINKSKTK